MENDFILNQHISLYFYRFCFYCADFLIAPSEDFFLGLFLVEVAGCDYRINTENRLQNTFALLLFAKKRCGVG